MVLCNKNKSQEFFADDKENCENDLNKYLHKGRFIFTTFKLYLDNEIKDKG